MRTAERVKKAVNSRRGSEPLSVERVLSRTGLLWRAALISMPLDVLLLSVPASFMPEAGGAAIISLLLLIAAVAFSLRPLAVRLIAKRSTLQQHSSTWQKGLVYGVVALVLAIGVVQLIGAVLHGERPGRIVAIVAIYGTAAWSMLRKFISLGSPGAARGGSAAAAAGFTALNALYQVTIARIAFARAVSLWAALVAASGQGGALYFTAYAVLALTLLLAARPGREDYVQRCRRCAGETPIGELRDGRCASCRIAAPQAPAHERRTSLGERLSGLIDRLDLEVRRRIAKPAPRPVRRMLLERLRAARERRTQV